MSFKKYISQLRYTFYVAIIAFSVVVIGASFSPTSFLNKDDLSNKTTHILASPLETNTAVSTIPITPKELVSTNTKAHSNKQTANFYQQLYGHLPYKQAEPEQMMIIGSYATGEYQRLESLDPEAGKALMKLIYAARNEGVWIVPVSGFRTIEQQAKLFEAQIKRRGSTEAAAKLSAPPGYSEHHTGLAIDLADGHFPNQDVTYQFETTDAYNWLKKHAKDFGFEMSFPPNNSQGISFEPWHWRYIGSPRATSTFSTARKLH